MSCEYIFAYGSNLCERQMISRCPSAVTVAVGRLENHRLAFVSYSRGWDGAVATVTSAPGRSVVGAVYRVARVDLAAMDRFEGFPFVYDRTRERIVDSKGRSVSAWVYKHLDPDHGRPAPAYLGRIIQGARAHGITLAPIHAAALESIRAAERERTARALQYVSAPREGLSRARAALGPALAPTKPAKGSDKPRRGSRRPVDSWRADPFHYDDGSGFFPSSRD